MGKDLDSRGRVALGRFDDPEVERSFLRQYRVGGMRNLAWAAGIGMLAYTAFALEHAMRSGWGLLGDPVQLAVMAARLLVVLVCLCVVLMIVHAPRRLLDHHVPIMSSVLLLTLVPVALFAPAAEPFQQAHFRSLTGFSITAFAVVVLLRLPVRVAASCSLISLSVLVASILAHDQWTVGVASLIVYPATAVLLGLVIAHVIEHRERAMFAMAAGARRQSAEKTRLIGELAHDMRGPLAAIGNEVDELQQRAGQLEPADLARRLATVEESIVRTRDYLEHLLAWCQAAGGEKPRHLGPVSLDVVVTRLKADLAAHAARHGVAFSVDIPAPVLGRNLFTHATELYAILHNLIDNAIKYRDQRPGARPFVRLRASPHGARCEVEVTDNGVGIDGPALRQIWDVGYRISRATGATAGSGLGLAIVKARVERLARHAIGVESEPGVGSRFWLRVPWADESEVFVADLPLTAAFEPAGGGGPPGPVTLSRPTGPAANGEGTRRVSLADRAAPGAGRVLVIGVDEQRWPGLMRRLGPFGPQAGRVPDPAGLEAHLAAQSLPFDVLLLDGGDAARVRQLIGLVRLDHGYEVPAIVLHGAYRRWSGRSPADGPDHIRHLARLASGERLRRAVEAAMAESLAMQRQLLDQEG